MNISTIVDEIIGIDQKCAVFGVKGVVISPIFLKRRVNLAKVIRQANDY